MGESQDPRRHWRIGPGGIQRGQSGQKTGNGFVAQAKGHHFAPVDVDEFHFATTPAGGGVTGGSPGSHQLGIAARACQPDKAWEESAEGGMEEVNGMVPCGVEGEREGSRVL